MKHRCWIYGLVLIAGCEDEPPPGPSANPAKSVEQVSTSTPLPQSVKFFSDWFHSHGHQDLVVDDFGVGVSGHPTRLRALLYGSKKSERGGFIVETEFRIRLDSEQEIVEFLAGIGDTEEQAINDTLANFIMTTFHVVYKAFINEDDPHMTSKRLDINGSTRNLIVGDLLLRSNQPKEKVDLSEMSEAIESTLGSLDLSPRPHWIKVVYGQIDGKATTIAVSMDNADSPALVDAVTRLEWPKSDGFYMAKQFIVIQ